MPDEDADARFARLEGELVELREQVTIARSDAAAARLLAAGADHDVSEVRAELRAHTRGLNALRETQLEQGRAISELRQEMQDGFATVNAAVGQIAALLTKGGGPERDDS